MTICLHLYGDICATKPQHRNCYAHLYAICCASLIVQITDIVYLILPWAGWFHWSMDLLNVCGSMICIIFGHCASTSMCNQNHLAKTSCQIRRVHRFLVEWYHSKMQKALLFWTLPFPRGKYITNFKLFLLLFFFAIPWPYCWLKSFSF